MVISTKGNGNVHFFFGSAAIFSSHFSWWGGISIYILLHLCPYESRISPHYFSNFTQTPHDHINNNKKAQHFICLRRLELWLLIQFFLPSTKNVELIRLEFLVTFKRTLFETFPFLSTHHPFLKECRPNLMMKKQFASLQLVFQSSRSISKKGNLLDNSDANQLEGHVLLKKLWT